VAAILALDQDGDRLIPLVSGGGSSKEARAELIKQNALDLFPGARAPQAALGGLWLYFSGASECHQIVQDIPSAEGSFWHGIVHRQEPDAGNAAYWFRQVGSHPIFRELGERAEDVVARRPKAGFHAAAHWDALAFIDFCEQARTQPGSDAEASALEIQRAEWQLLFDYCARSGS
jgi:hypothetical protein